MNRHRVRGPRIPFRLGGSPATKPVTDHAGPHFAGDRAEHAQRLRLFEGARRGEAAAIQELWDRYRLTLTVGP